MERIATYKDSVVYIDREGNFHSGYVDRAIKIKMEDARFWANGKGLSDAQYASFCKWLEYQLFLDRWRKRRDRVLGGKKLKVLV